MRRYVMESVQKVYCDECGDEINGFVFTDEDERDLCHPCSAPSFQGAIDRFVKNLAITKITEQPFF